MAIREYRFFCEKCSYEFSDYCDWEQIKNYKPSCTMCKSNKEVYRNYAAETVGINPGPKTVGMLADLNSQKGIRNEQAKKDREQEEASKKVGFKVESGRAHKI